MERTAYSKDERVLFLARNIQDKLDVLDLEGDSESVVEAVWGLCYSEVNLGVFADDEIFDAMVRCLYYYGEGVDVSPNVKRMFRAAIRDVQEQISRRNERRAQQFDRITSPY